MANSTTDVLSMRQDLMRSLRAEFSRQESRDKQAMMLSKETISYLQKATAATKGPGGTTIDSTNVIAKLADEFEDYAVLDEKYSKITYKWQKDSLQVWRDILEELKHCCNCHRDEGGGGRNNNRKPRGKGGEMEELLELAAVAAAATASIGALKDLGSTVSDLVTDIQNAGTNISNAGSGIFNGLKGLLPGSTPAPVVTPPGRAPTVVTPPGTPPGRTPAGVTPPGRQPAPSTRPGGIIHTLATRLHNAETASKDILNLGASLMTGQGTARSVHNVTHPNAQVRPSAKGLSPLQEAGLGLLAAGAVAAAPEVIGAAGLAGAGLALGAAGPAPAKPVNAAPINPKNVQVHPLTNYNVNGGTFDGKPLGPDPVQPSNTAQGRTFSNTVPLTQQYYNNGVYSGQQLYQNQVPVSNNYSGMITQAAYMVPQANSMPATPASYAMPSGMPDLSSLSGGSGLVPTDGSGISKWLGGLISLMGNLTGGSIFGGGAAGGSLLSNLLGGTGTGFLSNLFGGGGGSISSGTNIGANAGSTLQAIGNAAGNNQGLQSTLTQFAGVESTFDPNAGAGSSSAKGAFQITSPTAKAWIKKYGGVLGITDKNYNPNDPNQQAQLVAAWIKDQTSKDVKAGIAPTSANLYSQYFTGGNSLINADPNAIAANIDPAAAAANPNVFYADGQPRTVGEVNQFFSNRLGSQPSFASALQSSQYARSNAGQPSNAYAPSDTLAAGNATKAQPGVVQTAQHIGGGTTKATPNLDDLHMFHPDPGMRNANTYIPA